MQGTARSTRGRFVAALMVVLAMAAFAFVTPAAAQDEVTIDLNEINGSGISGTATLTDTATARRFRSK